MSENNRSANAGRPLFMREGNDLLLFGAPERPRRFSRRGRCRTAPNSLGSTECGTLFALQMLSSHFP